MSGEDESMIDPALDGPSAHATPTASPAPPLHQDIHNAASPAPSPAQDPTSTSKKPAKKPKTITPGSAADFRRKEANRLAAERSRMRASEKAKGIQYALEQETAENQRLLRLVREAEEAAWQRGVRVGDESGDAPSPAQQGRVQGHYEGQGADGAGVDEMTEGEMHAAIAAAHANVQAGQAQVPGDEREDIRANESGHGEGGAARAEVTEEEAELQSQDILAALMSGGLAGFDGFTDAQDAEHHSDPVHSGLGPQEGDVPRASTWPDAPLEGTGAGVDTAQGSIPASAEDATAGMASDETRRGDHSEPPSPFMRPTEIAATLSSAAARPNADHTYTPAATAPSPAASPAAVPSSSATRKKAALGSNNPQMQASRDIEKANLDYMYDPAAALTSVCSAVAVLLNAEMEKSLRDDVAASRASIAGLEREVKELMREITELEEMELRDGERFGAPGAEGRGIDGDGKNYRDEERGEGVEEGAQREKRAGESGEGAGDGAGSSSLKLRASHETPYATPNPLPLHIFAPIPTLRTTITALSSDTESLSARLPRAQEDVSLFRTLKVSEEARLSPVVRLWLKAERGREKAREREQEKAEDERENMEVGEKAEGVKAGLMLNEDGQGDRTQVQQGADGLDGSGSGPAGQGAHGTPEAGDAGTSGPQSQVQSQNPSQPLSHRSTAAQMHMQAHRYKEDKKHQGASARLNLKGLGGYLGAILWGSKNDAASGVADPTNYSTPAIARRRRGRPPKATLQPKQSHSMLYPLHPQHVSASPLGQARESQIATSFGSAAAEMADPADAAAAVAAATRTSGPSEGELGVGQQSRTGSERQGDGGAEGLDPATPVARSPDDHPSRDDGPARGDDQEAEQAHLQAQAQAIVKHLRASLAAEHDVEAIDAGVGGSAGADTGGDDDVEAAAHGAALTASQGRQADVQTSAAQEDVLAGHVVGAGLSGVPGSSPAGLRSGDEAGIPAGARSLGDVQALAGSKDLPDGLQGSDSERRRRRSTTGGPDEEQPSKRSKLHAAEEAEGALGGDASIAFPQPNTGSGSAGQGTNQQQERHSVRRLAEKDEGHSEYVGAENNKSGRTGANGGSSGRGRKRGSGRFLSHLHTQPPPPNPVNLLAAVQTAANLVDSTGTADFDPTAALGPAVAASRSERSNSSGPTDGSRSRGRGHYAPADDPQHSLPAPGSEESAEERRKRVLASVPQAVYDLQDHRFDPQHHYIREAQRAVEAAARQYQDEQDGVVAEDQQQQHEQQQQYEPAHHLYQDTQGYYEQPLSQHYDLQHQHQHHHHDQQPQQYIPHFDTSSQQHQYTHYQPQLDPNDPLLQQHYQHFQHSQQPQEPDHLPGQMMPGLSDDIGPRLGVGVGVGVGAGSGGGGGAGGGAEDMDMGMELGVGDVQVSPDLMAVFGVGHLQ